MRIFTITLILLLSACQAPLGDNAAVKASTPLLIATHKADSTAAIVATKTADRDAKVVADITHAKAANQDNQAGPPRTVIDSDLAVALTRLDGIIPDPLELLQMAQDAVLVQQGRAEAAQTAYEQSIASAKDLSSQLGQAKSAASLAAKQRDEAQANYIATAEANKVAADNAVQQARNSQHNAVLGKQVLYLNIAGALCLAIFGVGAGFGGLAGLRVVWPFLLYALMCFGLAQIVSQWWFMWAVGGVFVVGLGVGVWWIYRHYKMGTLAADATKKLAQAQGTLQAVVPVLDKAYEDSAQDRKDVLDHLIFNRLSSAMGSLSKQAIHLVRSDLAVKTPDSPVALTVTNTSS